MNIVICDIREEPGGDLNLADLPVTSPSATILEFQNAPPPFEVVLQLLSRARDFGVLTEPSYQCTETKQPQDLPKSDQLTKLSHGQISPDSQASTPTVPSVAEHEPSNHVSTSCMDAALPLPSACSADVTTSKFDPNVTLSGLQTQNIVCVNDLNAARCSPEMTNVLPGDIQCPASEVSETSRGDCGEQSVPYSESLRSQYGSQKGSSQSQTSVSLTINPRAESKRQMGVESFWCCQS